MASRRTWVWVLVGVGGLGVVALVAVAAAGAYFVTNRIQTETSTSVDAMHAFQAVTDRFGGATPLYEVDAADHARPTRPLEALPSSHTPPQDLWLLAWDPGDERLVRIALPFWMLRMGHKQKLSITANHEGFDLRRLNLDIDELERIGSALVVDVRHEDGLRVLLWTQ
jgi:hypothetical protein